jgi:hypothetical protein
VGEKNDLLSAVASDDIVDRVEHLVECLSCKVFGQAMYRHVTHIVFFKKKKKKSIALRPQPSGGAPHGYGGAKGRSSLKSCGFSLKFGEGVPKVWLGAARKLSQSLAGRLKRSNNSSYAPRTYPALGFWLPTPGVKNRSSGGVRRLGFC